jgi:hypothetical protein
MLSFHTCLDLLRTLSSDCSSFLKELRTNTNKMKLYDKHWIACTWHYARDKPCRLHSRNPLEVWMYSETWIHFSVCIIFTDPSLSFCVFWTNPTLYRLPAFIVFPYICVIFRTPNENDESRFHSTCCVCVACVLFSGRGKNPPMDQFPFQGVFSNVSDLHVQNQLWNVWFPMTLLVMTPPSWTKSERGAAESGSPQGMPSSAHGVRVQRLAHRFRFAAT